MKKFFSILVAAVFSATMWAETVTVEGIGYDLNTSTHVASVVTQQCFNVHNLVIPYHVDVEGTEYTVSVNNTNFSYWGCNVDSLVSIRLAEGHTQTGTMSSTLTHLLELSLPASCTQVGPTFVKMPHLRRLVCRAVTPPALPTQSGPQQVYDSAIVYVPAESVAAYQAHSEWGKFQHIVPMLGEMNRIIEIGSYHYELDESAHRAYMLHGFGPFPANISVPYLVTYEGENYTVDISRVQFNLMIAEPITKLQLAEGHTWLSFTYDWQFLETLELPSTFQTFADDALSQCHGLTKVICRAVTPPSMAASPSATACANAELWVPEISVDAYRAHAEWGRFANIVPISGESYSVRVDNVEYKITPSTHVALVVNQAFDVPDIVIPTQVEYNEETYVVDITGMEIVTTGTNLHSLRYAEGHTFFSIKGGGSFSELYLPSTLDSMRTDFKGLGWEKVVCMATTPPVFPDSLNRSDYGFYRKSKLCVPHGSVDAYRAHPVWGLFREIVETYSTDADTIRVDGILYNLDRTEKKATFAENTLTSSHTVIPHQLLIDGEEYSINIGFSGGFYYMHGGDSLYSLEIAEGHEELYMTITAWHDMQEMYLPSTMQLMKFDGNYFGNLQRVYCAALTPPDLVAEVDFSGFPTLYVHAGSVESYRAANKWSRSQNILPWIFDGDTMTIDSIVYQLYPSTGKASVNTAQCFPSNEIVIPHTVTFDTITYTVDLSDLYLGYPQCQRDSLRSITLAEGHTVMAIGLSLNALEELILPSTMELLRGNDMFAKYPNLKHVVCNATTPPEVFFATAPSPDATLEVPLASLEAYKSHASWGKFFHYLTEVDGIVYDVDVDSHIATVLTEQCLPIPNVEIPYHLDVASVEYTVSIDSTDMFCWSCNVNNLLSLTLAEGHTQMMSKTTISIVLQELYLPSTLTTLNVVLPGFTNLRKLECRAITPPVVPVPSDTVVAYENAVLYVPAQSIDAYRADPVWGNFRHIVPIGHILIDGIEYKLDTASHVASVISEQCFDNTLVVPYHVDVEGTEYTVSIDSTDFSRWPCNRDNLVSLRIAEGHTKMKLQTHVFSKLTELYLPSTFTSMYASFISLTHVRKLECRAITPPTLVTCPDTVSIFENAILYVPAESVEAYRTTYRWGKFTHIYPISVEIDGIEYDLDASTHVASVPSRQCFGDSSLVVPYHINVEDTEFTVSISNTDFFYWECNVDTLVSLNIAEGHTELARQHQAGNVPPILRDWYLPSTLTSMYVDFSMFANLRKIECRAIMPPSGLIPSDTAVAYDSAVVYVPLHSLDAYRADPVWGKFANFHAGVDGDTVTIGGILYQLYPSTGKAVVPREQCFQTSALTIPFQIAVGVDTLMVDISETDFFYWACNVDTLVSLRIEEGHTQLAQQYQRSSSSNPKLQELYLPSTMTLLKGSGFFNLVELTKVVCLAPTPPVLEDSLPDVVAYDSPTLYVPVKSYQRYKTHPQWGKFKNIYPIGFSKVFEVTDTAAYHNTLLYGIPDSANYALLIDFVLPMVGAGVVISDTVSDGEMTYPVEAINDSAFARAPGIQHIDAPARAPRCGAGAFYALNREATVVVVPHDSCVASYRADAEWNRFTNIVGRLAPGDTIFKEYYHVQPHYILSYMVLPDQRSVRLVRPNGDYDTKPSRTVELNDEVLGPNGLPYVLTEMGDSVLAGCGITSVSINARMKNIGAGALAGCTQLRTISIAPENPVYFSPQKSSAVVRREDGMLLYGSLSSQLEDSIRAIGEDAFAGLRIANITIPAGVGSIGARAFSGCALKQVRLLGEEPATLAENSFQGVDSMIPVFVPRAAYNTYRTHADWSKFVNITPWYEAGDTIVQRRAAGAYTSEYTLRYLVLDDGRVELMAPTYRIEDGLAAGLVDLTDTLAFRFVVSQLADGALRDCRDMHTVHLGRAVTYLGDSVFSGCSKLNWIICDAVNPPVATRETFADMDLSARVDVPASAYDIYKEADGWHFFYCFNPVLLDPNPESELVPGAEMGIEETELTEPVVKIVLDGHVWILREGVLYDLLGKRR